MKQKTRMLVEGAVMLALAQLLGYLKLWELPQGGSVVLSMLPIFFFCIRWGFRSGMLVSFAFSVLQLLLDGAYAWSWQSMFGDYILAFTALGLCGLFSKMRGGIYIGTVVGSLARFLCHYVTGATVWAEYMPEEFFGMTMTTPWLYSLLYNGSYMLLDMILCLVVSAILFEVTPLKKYLHGETLR